MCVRCAIDRRSLLAGGGALAAASMAGVAQARIRPADMVPLIGPGYRPPDKDEQGLWQQMERVEEEIAGSNLLIEDEGVTAYVRDLIGKVGGPAASDMRIYVAGIPEFNAMMVPPGFNKPSCSASSTIFMSIRSFMEFPGLKYSTFTNISPGIP